MHDFELTDDISGNRPYDHLALLEEQAAAGSWQFADQDQERVRFQITRNARIENVGKSQSCMRFLNYG